MNGKIVLGDGENPKKDSKQIFIAWNLFIYGFS